MPNQGKEQMRTTAIIIPAYNEAPVIGDTLKQLRSALRQHKINADLVVINDGSFDQTANVAAPLADYLLTHRLNCGLGASLATGIEFARRHHYQNCITFDADGQHNPADIVRALAQLARGYDIVIGSRFLGTHSGMPKTRRVVLFLGDLVTYLFFGVWTTDSQSGFRGLSRRAIDSLQLKSNRMEVSSEFFGEIKRLRLQYVEIPIHISYTPYSLAKGQKNSSSASVLLKLLYKLFN